MISKVGHSILSEVPGDFPGGSVVKNLPSNAVEYRFDPWPEN